MGDIDAPPATGAVDLLDGEGPGTIWRMTSDDLDATLQAFGPSHDVAEHVHDDVDVLVVVVDGDGTAFVDGEPHALTTGSALLIGRGARRGIRAGAAGVRYLRVLRHRDPQ